MADTLGFRTVIEAVLDAKGFEEFKKRVAEAGRQAGASGQASSEAGKHFDRLGKQLPVASFKILADEMLRNAGISGQNRVLTNLLEEAMMGLAAAGKITQTTFAGATLGLSLLIPLLFSLHKGTEQTAASTRNLGQADESLIENLETLKEKTRGLTEEQERLLNALLRVRDAKLGVEMAELQKKIKETTETMEKEAKLSHVFTGSFEDQAKAAQGLAIIHRENAKAAAMAAGELRNLKDQETILRATMDGVTESTKKQADALKRDLTAGAKAAADADRRVAAQFQAMHDSEAKNQQLRNEKDRKDFAKLQADKLAGEKKNAAQAKIALGQIVSARQSADKTILRNETVTARTRSQRRKAEYAEFKNDLDQRVADLRAAGMDELEIAGFVASEKKRYTRQVSDMEKQAQKAKLIAELEIAKSSIALLESQFGPNKAFAIAMAIINTAEAVTEALPNYPLAIAVGIAGAAEINTIRQQDFESGFDDPVNDLLAKRLGRKWADDYVNMVQSGFHERVGQHRTPFGGGQTIHQSTTVNRGTSIQNLNLGGFFGSNQRQLLLKLRRELIHIDRIEDRTRR